jgi:hypothetical protein
MYRLVIALILISAISIARAALLTAPSWLGETPSIAAQPCDSSPASETEAAAPDSCGLEQLPGPDPLVSSSGEVPDCADHDATTYHGLVKRDSSGAIECTYGHTHFDDPHQVDSFFGALPYGEISYPWQTLNENVGNKHSFYKWTVYDGACVAANSALGLRRFRLEAHADGNAGATTRFHSFFLQGEVCNPNNPAISYTISVGGHMDYGSLYVAGAYVPLPGDSGDSPGGNRRLHGSVANPRYDWTWYGSHALAGLGVRQEDWGPVDPLNLSRQLFYVAAGQNHSFQDPGHLITGVHPFNVPMSGFADRFGVPVTTACTLGPDCVPFDFGGLPPRRSFQFRADAGELPVREYDVKGSDGMTMIRFPN